MSQGNNPEEGTVPGSDWQIKTSEEIMIPCNVFLAAILRQIFSDTSTVHCRHISASLLKQLRFEASFRSFLWSLVHALEGQDAPQGVPAAPVVAGAGPPPPAFGRRMG